MKAYPPIPSSVGQSFREFDAHVFDKLDGSNLRFEWSKKRGWYKQGTRKRLFDETDEDFGPALPLFHDLLAAPLADIAKKQQWQAVQAWIVAVTERFSAEEAQTIINS